MTTIRANYAAMSAGHDGLVATWGRIERHLGELASGVAATNDMDADALTAFKLHKARWDAQATDRQAALRSLAEAVDEARLQYQQVDRNLAAQFGG